MCKLRNKFENIIKSYNQDNAALKKGHPLKCNDQFVAIIEITNDKVSFIENDILSDNRIKKHKYYKSTQNDTIAIILESPHKKEFEKETNIGPALGQTGFNISNYLLGNLAKLISINDLHNEGVYFNKNTNIENGKYKLLLINAVQFQCSLGILHGVKNKENRDEIFEKFFENDDAKNDFLKRLKQHNPKIIINCCTGGHYRKIDGLQKLVQDVIDGGNINAIKLAGYHPSSPLFAGGFYQV